MSNSRLVNQLASALLAAGLVAAAGWFWQSRNPSPPPPADRNRPVALYGRVVDEAGRPLPDATARMWVGRLEPLDAPDTRIAPADRMVALSRTAGADGAFAVEGYRGYVLNLMRVHAPGHLLSPWTKRGYLFLDVPAVHRPDPASPVQFRQWRRRNPTAREPAHTRASGPLAFDGPPVAFDLVNGTRPAAGEPGGDVRLRAVRHAEPVIRDGERWADDWSVVVEGVGAALARPRADDEFMFEAPADGYRESIEVRPRPDARGPLQAALFVRGRGGRLCGVVNLEFTRMSNRADHPPAVSLEAHVNTDGSPNLEFDYWHPADPESATPEALTLRFRGPPRP